MIANSLLDGYPSVKEKQLSHRYITNRHIKPLLDALPADFKVLTEGKSVNGLPIFSVTAGNGPKKLLFWSQMHGNESATTKAVFDLFNWLQVDDALQKHILSTCTLKIIPILNPDGAQVYTRHNANDVDLNRDAQDLSQPESVVLRQVFDGFKPDFCFNLHGQRTIFSAGEACKPATASFLSPAQDAKRSLTANRKKAMEIIVAINNILQQLIPEQVGVYDDAFNLNCVGDTFQHFGVPTILFEAGHFKGDYAREESRKYMWLSLVSAIRHISKNRVEGRSYNEYFSIPENKKLFLDIIIRNAKIDGDILDVGIQFQERLRESKVHFIPKIEKLEKLTGFFAHEEINANNTKVLTAGFNRLYLGYENDFVIVNNEKTLLYLTKS